MTSPGDDFDGKWREDLRENNYTGRVHHSAESDIDQLALVIIENTPVEVSLKLSL
jgi:hypothetical protein